MKQIGSLFALAILAACSGGFGTMDRIMSSWKGAPLDAVIAQWGYPAAERTIAGHHLYIWHTAIDMPLPATTTGTVSKIGDVAIVNLSANGGGTLQGRCQRILEVDSQNVVINWQWSGNNCPFADVAGEYARWERRP